MKTRITLLLLCAICVLGAEAQYKRQKAGGSDRVYFGGGFGLSVGTDVTAISAMPMVGYKWTDEFSTGVSVIYQYVNWKSIDYSTSNYGGSVFTRYIIMDSYFAHAEFEHLRYERVFVNSSGDITQKQRLGNNALLLGGGYRQPMGRNAAFMVTVLYDVLWKGIGESPYASPLNVRAGIAVGF
jgi:hypothetical protein